MNQYDTNQELIAPCGMNCAICSAYLAYSHQIPKKKGKTGHCSGCRPRNKQCAFIKKKCEILKSNQVNFCFECSDFPCANIKHLDKRYNERYMYSFVDNLVFIRENGLGKFIVKEKKQYKCAKCGDVICVHNKKCYSCNVQELS